MSLKTFHIAFISISSIAAFGFAVWNFNQVNGNHLTYGVLSVLAGFGLIIYGIKFLKKLKNVSYL